jgi:TPR repeat protein
MYAYGEGVIEDDKEAVKWYRLAAEQGDAGAQNNLGLMHASGEGVIQDNVYAHMWLNIAAANGNEGARGSKDKVVKRMTPQDISKAQDLARKCVKKNYKDC